jgi:Kef-type K+ transport system membrane component KefB
MHMPSNAIINSIFYIFFGAAILATIALYTRQSLLVCYILLGMLIGPPGLHLVSSTGLIQQIGDIGIIFLLFLLGLHLHPQKLLHMLKKVTWVALVSSVVFFCVGFAVPYLFGYGLTASIVVGASMMFSSTIIALKLLPTTILHHQHTGELMISVLLMQDLLAIIVLLVLHGASQGTLQWTHFALTALSLPGLLLAAFLVEYFILSKLFVKFDRIREYLFLLSIAWCLGMSDLAQRIGLSPEIGAFIGGVAIATSPIAVYIAESLRPLRDFFLVMFFFAIGASLNPDYFAQVIVPAIILASLFLVIKPVVFGYLLRQTSETKHVAWEVGCRLGQASEFSILVAYLAASSQTSFLSAKGSNLIQVTTILTFIVSSYWVVMRYPTPMSLVDRLRRD